MHKNCRDLEIGLTAENGFVLFSFFSRGRPHCMYETGWNSPSGHRAIYSGDDTWSHSIRKALKEACGDNDKRQVVDFMYETVSIKEESSQSSSGQHHVPVQ